MPLDLKNLAAVTIFSHLALVQSLLADVDMVARLALSMKSGGSYDLRQR